MKTFAGVFHAGPSEREYTIEDTVAEDEPVVYRRVLEGCCHSYRSSDAPTAVTWPTRRSSTKTRLDLKGSTDE